MDKHQKRRLRDTKRTVDNLRNKFIAKYVEGMYGDVYVEAQELYEDVRRKNPGRKDLTKTVEFMNAAMPYKAIPFYYYVKQRKLSQTCEPTSSKPTRTRSTTTSRMVLNIPLMPLTSTTSPPISTTSDVENPPSPPISTTSDVEIPPSQPISTTSDVEIPPSQPQLEIPAHVYSDILQELRQDPDLWQILNDFNNQDDIGQNVEIGHEHDEGRNDMWDSFQDQTPLERELELQGY